MDRITRKRSREEMKVAVLRVCLKPTKPTHILWKVGSNYPTLQALISELLKKGLLENYQLPDRDARSSVYYHTTEEGRKVAEALKAL